MLLKHIRFLVTQDARRSILENVDVRIQENRIAEVRPGIEPDGEEVLDCSGRIVLPGMINAHAHIEMTAMRGLHDHGELREWLAEVIPEESRLSEADFGEAARIGILEALRTGTTTIVDHYRPVEPGARAAAALGVRWYGMIAFSDIHGHGVQHVGLPEPESPLTTFGFGPHAIASVTENLLRNLKAAANQRGVLFHMHLSETRRERAEFKARTGMLPVEYLNSLGLLGPNVMLVHCVWLTKGELDLIARRGAKIVHCPQSNMKLAGGGVMPLREMQERGITVCLGTDSAVSNNALDMFREMHVTALLHRHHYWDAAAASAQEVLDLATVNGAHALGRDDLGSVEEGKLADLIALDLRDENLRPCSKDRVVSHLIYAANGMNVSEVVVDGKLVVKNKGFR